MADQNVQSDGDKLLELIATGYVIDDATDAPAFNGHDDTLRQVRSVDMKAVYLTLDQVDEDGYGHAHDPKNENDRFTIAMRTLPDATKLKLGRQFYARVNKTHFVTEVLQIL